MMSGSWCLDTRKYEQYRGDRAEKSLEFQKMLEKRTGLPVVMWDERLTTVEAHRTMMESGVRREDRKKYVDKLAAVYILQGYLDHEGMKRKGRSQSDLKQGCNRFIMEKITFTLADNQMVEFYVLEQTVLGGISYILVTDSEDDEAEALILKDLSKPGEDEALYEIVDDDDELEAVSKSSRKCWMILNLNKEPERKRNRR